MAHEGVDTDTKQVGQTTNVRGGGLSRCNVGQSDGGQDEHDEKGLPPDNSVIIMGVDNYNES